MDKTLLPTGLYDLLPPHAEMARRTVHGFLEFFSGFGYQEISPPLLEFEDSLLRGQESTLGSQTFRVMDPASGHMMGFRPDITMQAGRVASERLGNEARPLRLCYAGPCLRVTPEPLENSRQPFQVGMELIGAASPDTDAEVILVAVHALHDAGFSDVTVDVNLSSLLPLLLAGDEAAASHPSQVEAALAAKDTATLERLGLREAKRVAGLLRAAGPVSLALPKITSLLDGPRFAPQLSVLEHVITRLQESGLTVTLDLLEAQGFAYHHGIRFSLFVAGLRKEAARGGRYIIERADGAREEATGCTLYADRLLSAMTPQAQKDRLYVPYGEDFSVLNALRMDGYAVVQGLGQHLQAAAKRLGCVGYWHNKTITKV